MKRKICCLLVLTLIMILAGCGNKIKRLFPPESMESGENGRIEEIPEEEKSETRESVAVSPESISEETGVECIMPITTQDLEDDYRSYGLARPSSDILYEDKAAKTETVNIIFPYSIVCECDYAIGIKDATEKTFLFKYPYQYVSFGPIGCGTIEKEDIKISTKKKVNSSSLNITYYKLLVVDRELSESTMPVIVQPSDTSRYTYEIGNNKDETFSPDYIVIGDNLSVSDSYEYEYVSEMGN